MLPQWHARTESQQVTLFSRVYGTRLSFGPTPERLHAPELLV